MAEESSFQGLNSRNSLAVVEAVGMWESRSDFQGGCETRRVSHPPSFPPPLLPRASFFPEAGRPQLLEEFAFGLLHTLGGFEVTVAHVFADHRAILGLHQAVIVAVPRPAFGLLDQQLVQQARHPGINELAAVIGVKAADAE